MTGTRQKSKRPKEVNMQMPCGYVDVHRWTCMGGYMRVGT